MKTWPKAVIILLILAMIGSMFTGCGGGGGKETTTIVIGELNDLTGAASFACLPIHQGLDDIVRYWNENDLIPGVTLKLVAYDTILDAARTTVGYEYLKSKGMDVLVTVVAWDAVTLKAATERDKIPLWSLSSTEAMISPPGWIFCATPPADYQYPVTLKWVSENDWDYTKGLPKVAFMSQDSEGDRTCEKATRTYCQAHPDKFNWIGSALLPLNTQSFLSEAKVLKDCDYLGVYGGSIGSIGRDIAAAGGNPVLIDGGGSGPTGMSYYTSVAGWNSLDGMLTSQASLDWSDTHYQVDLAKQLLQDYRGKTSAGVSTGYLSAYQIAWPLLEVIKNTVDKVGAKDVDGQAIRDAVFEYRIDSGSAYWQGFPEWAFTQTKMYLADSIRLYRWSAASKGMAVTSDWFSIEI